MTEYDVGVLRKIADDLDAQAQRIIVTMGVFGGVAGFIASGLGMAVTNTGNRGLWGREELAIVFVFMAIGAGVGFIAGQSRSLALRAQAQALLCQVSIERHLATLVSRGAPPT